MKCSHCGEDLAEHATDIAIGLPDPIFDLSSSERESRCFTSEDLCSLDGERFFIRGVVPIPLDEAPGHHFGLGLWAEVPRRHFERYVELYDEDASAEPIFQGILANRIPGYDALGHDVDVRLGGTEVRPLFALVQSDHTMSRDQRRGISFARLHEIHDACGPENQETAHEPTKAFCLDAADIVDLVPNLGYCFATDRITVDGEKVGYMYREAPDDDTDSGWRFVAGDESDDYMDDSEKLGLYDVNVLANYDRDIIPFLETPHECAFGRDPRTGSFVRDEG